MTNTNKTYYGNYVFLIPIDEDITETVEINPKEERLFDDVFLNFYRAGMSTRKNINGFEMEA